MEFISSILSPYKETIGSIAGVCTIAQMFSAIPLLFAIRKKGSTSEFSIIPFIGGIIFGIMNLQFALILNDPAMINVNLFGIALNISYLSVFYYYTLKRERSQLWTKVGYGIAFVIGLIGYVQYEDKKLIEFRFGMILTVALFLLIGSPLFNLGNIIRNKSTEGMPFPMIASGTVVGSLWFLYGFAINNTTVVFQNAVALFLTLIQLSLFVIYPTKSSIETTKKIKSTKKKNKRE